MNKKNLLSAEKSPYLLQHKDNPVNWHPWGEDAFEAARKENKPIFLSIGYSTCYWCHVMEQDSFEVEEVAQLLNERFVSIKVDREERPDIDAVYMDAVMAMTGNGGWPMSVFLTPDLKPFFAGTFFWRKQFLHILAEIAEQWQANHEKILASSAEVTAFLSKQAAGEKQELLAEDLFERVVEDLEKSFDRSWGSFGKAPKFPPSDRAQLLLRLWKQNGSRSALHMATFTLEKMARGGIYDHLGGGFARYSTDEKWLVPHFEKMLYDNALLGTAYLEAYRVTKNDLFSAVARETLDYVLREMKDEDGGFYSAQDAGEVGKEGEFYVWKRADLKDILNPEELSLLERVYGVSRGGNFEHGTNILNLQAAYDWDSKSDPLLESAHEKLRKAREERPPPHKDDKVLTAWNGLMIGAMAKGYQVLGDSRYLDAAREAASFIREHLYRDGRLLRSYRGGEARYNAYLDDYAFLIDGLIALYEASFEKEWLLWAKELQAKQDELFWDSSAGGYFYSNPDDSSVLVRKKSFQDGALPSSNGVSALNLLRLADFFFEGSYQERAFEVFRAAAPYVNQYPSAFATTLSAYNYSTSGSKQVVVVGILDSDAAKSCLSFLRSEFIPNKVVAYGEPAELQDEGALPLFRGKEILDQKTTFYVCENNVCKKPTTDLEKAKRLILAPAA